MTLVLETRRDITLDAFYRVAWQGEGVRFHDDARASMGRAREAFLRLLDEDPEIVIYGVTSGFGQMAHLRFTPEERRAHARRKPHATATSFGEALPERVVRGIVLARLANFAGGHAAITPALAEAVAAMLDGGPLPAVPALGNGCPGEILALGHLFAPLTRDIDLAEKDSNALVNGSPCASALIADAVLAARQRLALAVEVFALSIEALQAPLDHYDPVLEELWDDPHETGALRGLRAWLEGAAATRRSYQAPVSWRILPRVLGQAAWARARAEEVAATSLAAVSDNPVFIPPDEAHPGGRVLSNGGYHNAKAYPALDNLAASWADLTLIADRQVTKMMDSRTSGLPDYLVSAEGGYPGCLGFAAAAYSEQARHAAARSFLPGSEGGGFGQNDVAVPTFFSWRREAEAGDCMLAGLAILAAAASQAFEVTGRAAPPRLAPLLEEVRALCPPVTENRVLGPDVEAVRDHLAAKVFAGALADQAGL
jgi:histidine ammonia-lyase